MQLLAQKVKSYIKDTSRFLNKIKKLKNLLDGAFLCTMNVTGRFTDTPHGKGLASLRKFLETRDKKQTFTGVTGVVLNHNIFEFDEKTFNQRRGTAIETKFATFCILLFMADLEEKLLESFEKKPMILRRYIDDTFFIWQHCEQSLKVFIEQVSKFYSTVKFTAEYSKKEKYLCIF